MKQGVLTTGRVRLLLSKGHSCFRPRRSGERRRKSVRGCIVDSNLSVISLVVVKKGMMSIAFIYQNKIFQGRNDELYNSLHHLSADCVLIICPDVPGNICMDDRQQCHAEEWRFKII